MAVDANWLCADETVHAVCMVTTNAALPFSKWPFLRRCTSMGGDSRPLLNHAATSGASSRLTVGSRRGAITGITAS
jgi:hypothetical protein